MRDLRYELELFHRIEGATVNGVSLTELVLYDDVALWQRLHQAIFHGEIRGFARTRSFSAFQKEERKSFKRPLRGAMATFAAVCLSLVAILLAVIRRPRVILFSIDKASDGVYKSDFRLRGVYRTLTDNRVSYLECFHTLLGRSLVVNAFTRKRFAFYMEAFDWFYLITQPKPTSLTIENVFGTEDEIAFIQHLIKKYVHARGLLIFRKKYSRSCSKSPERAVWWVLMTPGTITNLLPLRVNYTFLP